MASYEELHESVIDGYEDKVPGLVSALLDSGIELLDVMADGLISPMSVVGQRMKTGEMFIPEVLASAQAVSRGMELIKSRIPAEKLSGISVGKFLIGTVQGDVHNIGKNIVSMLMSSVGFEVVDIGVDVPADKFREAVEQEQPVILGMSALLTTTMPYMKEVIDVLAQNNLREKVRVLVGGAPVTEDFAKSIGADGYAPDAVTAVDTAKQLLG